METAKYIEEQKRIAKTAYNIFREKGFANTSIKDIADAAGIRKALVQYYFPKKDLFIQMFIEESMDIISKSIIEDNISSNGGFDTLYLMGYFETWYLTKHESMKQLNYDILSSRTNTETIISTIEAWVFSYINPSNTDERKAISDAITVAVGGCFEFIFRRMQKNEPVQIEMLLDNVVKQMNAFLGIITPPISVETKLTDEWLENKANELDNLMFN